MSFLKLLFLTAIVSMVIIACKNQMSTKASDARSDVDIATAKKLISENPHMVILDVRTPGETKGGKLPNAIEIDYLSSDFSQQIENLDKTKTYLVYCKSGGRSSSACDKMAEAGFTDVINMKGGYSSWK